MWQLEPSRLEISPFGFSQARTTGGPALPTVPDAALEEAPLVDSVEPPPVVFATSVETPTMRVDQFGYRSLRHLRQALEQLDTPDDGVGLTVIVMLDDRFCGHLPTLIARRHAGSRLVLASGSGRLPGLARVSNLAETSDSLGWRQIRFSREPEQALVDAIAEMADGARVVVCFPDWAGS